MLRPDLGFGDQRVARTFLPWRLLTSHALAHLLVLQLLAAGLVLGLQVQAHPTGSLALCTPSLTQTQADPDTGTDEGLDRWCTLACALVGLTGFSPPPAPAVAHVDLGRIAARAPLPLSRILRSQTVSAFSARAPPVAV